MPIAKFIISKIKGNGNFLFLCFIFISNNLFAQIFSFGFQKNYNTYITQPYFPFRNQGWYIANGFGGGVYYGSRNADCISINLGYLVKNGSLTSHIL